MCSMGIGCGFGFHLIRGGGGGGSPCARQIVTATWTSVDGRVNGMDATHGSIVPSTFRNEVITTLYVVDGYYLTVLDFGGNYIYGTTEIYLNVGGNVVTLTWDSTDNRYEGTGSSALYAALGDYGNDTCINITDDYTAISLLLELPQPDPTTGLYDLGGWVNASTTPQTVEDFEGKLVEIPAGVVPIGNRRVVNNSGVIEYYNRDAGGTLISGDATFEHAPERTNYSSGYNLNPTGISGLTLSGDAAATLTLVTDAAYYPPELSGICNGYVFKLDNSAGTSYADVTESDNTNNTDRKVLSAWISVESGSVDLRGAASGINGRVFPAGRAYQRYIAIPPSYLIGDRFRIRAQAGAVCYFIGYMTEAGDFAGPLIETNGAFATRYTTQIEHPYSSSFFNQAEGTCVVKFKMVSALSDTFGALSLSEDSVSGLTINTVREADSAGNVSSATGFSPATNDVITIGSRWNAASAVMQIEYKINSSAWVKGAETAYSGAFDHGALIHLMFGATNTIDVLVCDVFDTDQGTTWIESNY